MFTALLRMLWTFSRNFVDTWRKKGDCWEPVLKCGDKNPRCSHDCSLIAVRKLYWRFANFQISIKTIWLTSAKKQWWDDGVVWRIPGPGPGDCGACAKYSQHCAPSSLAYCTWTLETVQIIVQNIHVTGRWSQQQPGHGVTTHSGQGHGDKVNFFLVFCFV